MLDNKRDSSHCVLCKEYHWKDLTGPSTIPSPVSQPPPPQVSRKRLQEIIMCGETLGWHSFFVLLANLGNSWERVIESMTPKENTEDIMPKAPAVHRRSLSSILTGQYKVVFSGRKFFC